MWTTEHSLINTISLASVQGVHYISILHGSKVHVSACTSSTVHVQCKNIGVGKQAFHFSHLVGWAEDINSFENFIIIFEYLPSGNLPSVNFCSMLFVKIPNLFFPHHLSTHCALAWCSLGSFVPCKFTFFLLHAL